MKNTLFKKPAAILIYIMIGAGFLIFMLLIGRGDFAPKKNGFSRKAMPMNIHVLGKIENKKTFLSLAGYHDSTIYLSGNNAGQLFMWDKYLSNPHVLLLRIPPNTKINSRFEMEIDSSGIRLFAGNVPAVYYFKLNGTWFKTVNNLPEVFTRSVSLNPTSFMVRIIHKRGTLYDAVFAKYNAVNNELIYEQGISALNGDLGFSDDGLLCFDMLTKMAVYVELFSNKITAIDTNLKVVYRKHTIDTISSNRANYNSMKLGDKKEFTNTSPKRLINSESYVDRGKLFVKSNLQADNETDNIFSDNSPIDVYSVKDGSYEGSFYLPNDNGKKVLRFQVFHDLLIALYEDHVMTYRLTLNNANVR